MKLPPSPLARDDVLRLLDACPDTWAGVRDRALVAVLYRTGLRLSEALGLDRGDVRPTGGGAILRVRCVKGQGRGAPPRETGLDPKGWDELRDWLDIADAGRITDCEPGRITDEEIPVFVTGSGARLLPSYVRGMLPRIAKRAGIPGRVHAHGLRHTFAREFYEETGDVVRTSRALGHRNIATTDNYLRSIGVTQAAEANMEREW